MRATFSKAPPRAPAPPRRVGTLEYQMIERALHVQLPGDSGFQTDEAGQEAGLKVANALTDKVIDLSSQLTVVSESLEKTFFF